MSRLRQVREERGLRREDLASRAGISYQYVRILESSDPPTPGLEIARRIAEALGATVDDIFPTADVVVAPVPDTGAPDAA
jgi:transcriptional regulator with XRE-family HTH domain